MTSSIAKICGSGHNKRPRSVEIEDSSGAPVKSSSRTQYVSCSGGPGAHSFGP